MTDEIKGLINPEIWQNAQDNNQDPYGGACVNVAHNVMKHLDTFEGDFNIGYNPDMTTPHGIICECDNQGGITGFMAGAVVSMVCGCHKLGWKFYLANHISSYDVDAKDRLDEVVDELVEAEHIDVSKEEAEEYIEGLVGRYKAKLAERTPEQVAEDEAEEAAATAAAEEIAGHIKEFVERSEEVDNGSETTS